MDFIDLKHQQSLIKARLDKKIQEVLAHGRYIQGPEVTELEEKLQDYTGAKNCIACSSGTDALLLALLALKVQAGDEIITTPFTFFATGEVISLLGAKAVFVDIEPDTYNIDAQKIEEKITSKTKAIIPVSLYGQCADMDTINAIGEKYNIPVIEDGAQSFGAEYKDRKSCNLSTISCTSFFPSKPLGCYGDAGACFTNDESLSKTLRELSVHGQSERYTHTSIGINGRLDTLQAAILICKMDIFEEEVKKRAQIGEKYTALLHQSVKTPTIKEGRTSVYAQYTIEVEDRPSFVEKMKAQKIPTAVHYPIPLHKQPIYQKLGYEGVSTPIAEDASKKVVSLPMHPYLKQEQVQQVASAVLNSI